MLVAAYSLAAQSDTAAMRLAETERAFSRAAGIKGIKSAFLEYFDDECVVFAPRPTNGRQLYASDSDSHDILVWKPAVAEASASGDFGYTTGPSEYRSGDSTDTSVHYGYFVSMWKKNSSGVWRVILDIGLGYPEKSRKEEPARVRQLHRQSKDRTKLKGGARASLNASDREFGLRETEKGSEATLMDFCTDDARVYRPGFFPAEGRSNFHPLVRDEKFSQDIFNNGEVSQAGDLGVTYGLVISASSDTSNYVRIWRWENSWKVVIDVVKPWIPKK